MDNSSSEVLHAALRHSGLPISYCSRVAASLILAMVTASAAVVVVSSCNTFVCCISSVGESVVVAVEILSYFFIHVFH